VSSESSDSERPDTPGLGNEPGDARQEQPLSKIKPVYLLSAVAVAVVIVAVVLIIAIGKA